MKKSILSTIIFFLISIIVIILSFGFEQEVAYYDSEEEIIYLDEIEEDEDEKIFIRRRIDFIAPSFFSEQNRNAKIINANKEEFIDTSSITKDSISSLDKKEKLLTKSSLKNYNKDKQKSTSIINIERRITTSEIRMEKYVNEDNLAALQIDKDSIYRYEPLKLDIKIDNKIDLSRHDIEVYIRKIPTKKLIMNVDNKHNLNVIYVGKNRFKSMYLHTFGGEVGEYEFIVMFSKNDKDYLYKKPFVVKKRYVEPIEKTMSVITLEYNARIKNKKIPSPDGGYTSYHGLYDWARFMKANTFWVLGGQTTGWYSKTSAKNPWSANPIENIELLASSKNKKDIDLGAYAISFFTPGGGHTKSGYDVSVRYNKGSGTLSSSLHVSLNSQKRIDDIIKLFKEFDKNENISYIGFDFIRTGSRDGFEMVEEMVETTGVITPANWTKMSRNEKMIWLAKNVMGGSRSINLKWRWFRAHKTASIIKQVKDAGIKKRLWVFTLGWDHGEEHGQDPYMFLDAGAYVDAVMLYEASRDQYRNMMIMWPEYLHGDNNIIGGHMTDRRFLDGHPIPQIEYMRRYFEATKKLNRDDRLKGIFFHDISRMLWSRFKGANIREWSYVNASIKSRIEEKYNETPIKLTLSLNDRARTGVLKLENISSKDINTSLMLETHRGTNLSSLSFANNSIPQLKAGESIELPFKFKYRDGQSGTVGVIAVRVKSPDEKINNVAVIYTSVATQYLVAKADIKPTTIDTQLRIINNVPSLTKHY